MTSEETYKALLATMRKYSDFGAQDSEGYHALDILERSIEQGQPFPFEEKDNVFTRACGGYNPFQLYQSVDGWEVASAELIEAARAHWKVKMGERLGVTIS